jgi:chromosome segregation ATPase
MIEEKINQHEQELANWQAKHQELLNALRQAEQQIIAHSAVIEALRELVASATMETDEP